MVRVPPFDPTRPPVVPRDAATLILVREAPATSTAAAGLEVLFMQRSIKSSFMGGAVVFPGGHIEPGDGGWDDAVAPSRGGEGEWWDEAGRAARVAACREALEEVGVLPLLGEPVGPEVVDALRQASSGGPAALREALVAHGLSLDVASLVPFARWVTPEAEPKRFDARFFVAPAPRTQEAVSDQREATRVGWARPEELLSRYEAGEITLFPPTHRTLRQLHAARSVEGVFEAAKGACLSVICPRYALVDGSPILALPGDPLHEVSERRVAGGSRYVLREARWVEEDVER